MKRSIIIWVVKTATQNGADYIVAKFQTPEAAEKFEFNNREKYNFNLWIERFIYIK